uniref:Histidine kinase/HSP90-like ATPase domain-containing protein n=1 Tax=viral metagenome TaxID=1070528 RepID=A0A6C0BMA4_9ZZZZ
MFISIHLSHLLSTLSVIRVFRWTLRKKRDRHTVQGEMRHIIHQYQIPNTGYEFERAIGNAMVHGKFPIKCKMYIGSQGRMICVIRDHGNGFDYQAAINQFNRGQKYYHYHGLGFRTYARNRLLKVDWESHGRKIILCYNFT